MMAMHQRLTLYWVLMLVVIRDLSDAGVFNPMTDDPRPVVYPGQANIGLLVDIHEPSRNGTGCGPIRQDGVQQVMAAVWTAHQINLRKEPHELNLGIYIYDTCNQEAIAQRQTVRLLGHVGHAQPSACQEGRTPPIFGVVTHGTPDQLHSSIKSMEAFAVPVVATSEATMEEVSPPANFFSTSPSAYAQARAVLTVVKRMVWRDVALLISKKIPHHMGQVFQEIARKVEIDVVPMKHIPSVDLGNEDDMDSKDKSKQTTPKGVVLFLQTAEALQLLQNLHAVPNSRSSWIIVTPEDITFKLKHSLSSSSRCHLENVLLMSPVVSRIPEFQMYFQQLLRDGMFSDHPLVSELAGDMGINSKEHYVPTMLATDGTLTLIPLNSAMSRSYQDVPSKRSDFENTTVEEANVTPMVKAIWTLANSIRAVQKRFCRPMSDCLLYLQKMLSAQVLQSAKTMNQVIRGSGVTSLEGTRLQFSKNGFLSSNRYTLRALSPSCDIMEVGWYSDDSGLHLDEVVLSSKSSMTSTAKSFQHYLSPASLRMSSLAAQQDSRSAVSRSVTPNTVSKKPKIERLQDDVGVHNLKEPTLAAWLAKPWCLFVLVLSILGALSTLYVFVFLLMKACEGMMKRVNHSLSVFHMISLWIMYTSAALFVFKPSQSICAARWSLHNIAYAACFGCMLLRAMHLRAQNAIGLGGRVSKLNQFLTLLFILGLQLSLEMQRWRYQQIRVTIESASSVICSYPPGDFLLSLTYPSALLFLLVSVAFSTRHTPFVYQEGSQLFVTSAICVPVFVVCVVLCGVLSDPFHRDLSIALSMITMATIILAGIFGPQLYSIHKYGGIPHKPLSYADSLSTVFTMFKDLDNVSGGSTSSRANKQAKTLESPFVGRKGGEAVRNPLYDEYHSAYP